MNTSKPKLLLVGSTGGSVHVKTYYNLVKDYFEDILVLATHPVDFAQFEIADFSIKNPFTAIKRIRKIRRVIENFQPDIIHIHQANSCAWFTIKANSTNIPVVLTTWGTDVLVNPKKNLLFRYIARYSLQKAQVITADAQYMIEAINKLVPSKPCTLVNFGVDVDVQIDGNVKQKIIYSNRLHKDLYNIDKIILAFKEFHEINQDWKLIIGANGVLTENLKELAKQNLDVDSYEFIGFVDSAVNKEYYLKAQIWVSVPSTDGTAISLLEAMNYGCIPVVSDLPANKEWVEDNVNGVIVKNSLSKSLLNALNLNSENVAKLNRAIIEQRASKQVNQLKFFKIYDDLIVKN